MTLDGVSGGGGGPINDRCGTLPMEARRWSAMTAVRGVCETLGSGYVFGLWPALQTHGNSAVRECDETALFGGFMDVDATSECGYLLLRIQAQACSIFTYTCGGSKQVAVGTAGRRLKDANILAGGSRGRQGVCMLIVGHGSVSCLKGCGMDG